MNRDDITMDKIIALAKGRGFVYQGSEIYGGLSNSWDYGPLGAVLKNNLKQLWWDSFIKKSPYNIGLDTGILMNKSVWESSGHVGGFSDPLIDCKQCKTRHRADELIESQININISGLTKDKLDKIITEEKIKCPNCGASDFTPIRSFNLMFKTYLGVTDDQKDEIYLRPETAQGIFINFSNVLRTTRKQIPFGIGQIGKSFRNEITPKNFIFRMREFEQMELEFFVEPGTESKWFSYWKDFCYNFLIGLGIDKSLLRIRDHKQEELAHYSNATSDIEFKFPFGFGELWGISSRTDFDLKRHSASSGKPLEYFDRQSGKKYIPYCIEPSVGVDRLFLATLINAYDNETLENDTRTVLHLSPKLAPVKVAVLPLSKKLSPSALKIYETLTGEFDAEFDETGSIGKRYRRQDEIGTPYCITYDFDSETDKQVTVRERDTMAQNRIPISGLSDYLKQKL